jgi:hypothetical protein
VYLLRKLKGTSVLKWHGPSIHPVAPIPVALMPVVPSVDVMERASASLNPHSMEPFAEISIVVEVPTARQGNALHKRKTAMTATPAQQNLVWMEIVRTLP